MPTLPPEILKNVFYLYDTVDSARAGHGSGGTGFIASVPCSADPSLAFAYAVTNYHVAVRDGFSVVRINSKAGTPDIFEFGPEDWHFDPNAGHDVAVAHLPVRGDVHDHILNDIDAFVTRERHQQNKIGPGDEVVMVGRFVAHDGGSTNIPAVRFGHISINPAPIPSDHFSQKPVEMYCLDMNSRGGYSGSPVFVYRSFAQDLAGLIEHTKKNKAQQIMMVGPPMFMLLGIHTGQFREWWDIENQEGTEAERRRQAQVRGLSGMTTVTPAWTIADLLNCPKLVAMRSAAEGLLRAARAAIKNDSPHVVPE